MLEININPFPELSTPRLFLRQIRPEDAGEILLLRSDEKVNEFVDRKRAASLADAHQFIDMIMAAENSGKSLMWAITIKDQPKLIGTILYWNVVKEKDEADIGYELLPQWHGKGIMQEALSKVIEFGYKTLRLRRIIAEPKVGNQKSINLLEKCGFAEIGRTDEGYIIYELRN